MAKQDDWVRITLRLPPELHAYLTEQAGAASLNAEIIDRLYVSQGLDEAGQEILGVGKALSPVHQMPEITITLDATGAPISWDEINENIAGLRAALKGVSVAAMNVIVNTPELASSLDRRDMAAVLRQAWALEAAERKGASDPTRRRRRKLKID